jgi:hypothetical protein
LHVAHELVMVHPTHGRGVVIRVLHVAHELVMVHPTHGRGVVMRVLHVAHQCHGAPHTRTWCGDMCVACSTRTCRGAPHTRTCCCHVISPPLTFTMTGLARHAHLQHRGRHITTTTTTITNTTTTTTTTTTVTTTTTNTASTTTTATAVFTRLCRAGLSTSGKQLRALQLAKCERKLEQKYLRRRWSRCTCIQTHIVTHDVPVSAHSHTSSCTTVRVSIS